MRKIFLFTSVFFCVLVHSNTIKEQTTALFDIMIDSAVEDTTEYDLIVSDPGFEGFLLAQLPMNYHTESYYKNWNSRYVVEYNIRYSNGPRRELYENEINYLPCTEYGIELEYKLYYYFIFFETTNKVSLIHRAK